MVIPSLMVIIPGWKDPQCRHNNFDDDVNDHDHDNNFDDDVNDHDHDNHFDEDDGDDEDDDDSDGDDIHFLFIRKFPMDWELSFLAQSIFEGSENLWNFLLYNL